MARLVHTILRITAWLLVGATFFTLFSGFFLTKPFLASWVGYNTSHYIHTVLVPLVFIPLFFLHTLTGLFVLLSRYEFFNRKPFKIAAGLFWIGIFLFFVSFYEAQPPASLSGARSASLSFANSSGSGPVQLLTLSEVGRHSSAGDCWMVIGSGVYDLTGYLPLHPGGPDSMVPYCGKNATVAFGTKDRGAPHSSYAESLLASYYLGEVGSAAGTNPPAADLVLPAVSNSSGPALLSPAPPSSGPSKFTFADVGRHNTAGDCWMVIGVKVYDFTTYLYAHPGGAYTMVPYCGADGTAAFASRGGTGSHSSYASGMLASYYVGDLAADSAPPASSQPKPPPQNQSQVPPPPAPAPPPANPSIFSLADVASHNSQGSCWMVVSGNVYDLTSYLPLHPPGAAPILPYCGGDGTAAFGSVGHSSYASGLLSSYYLGVLGATQNPPPPVLALSVSASPVSVVVGALASVSFTVTSNGTPVGGALVSLSGAAAGSGTTDGNGVVQIAVNAGVAGTVSVTASKANYTNGATALTAISPPPGDDD